jgi:ribosomal protein L37AE/L43A
MATISVPWKTKLPEKPVVKEEPKVEKTIIYVERKEKEQPKVQEVQISEGVSHECPMCKEPVNLVRRELGFWLCTKCTPQGIKPLGVMDYSSKTGGVLMLVNDRKLFKIAKELNLKVGYVYVGNKHDEP